MPVATTSPRTARRFLAEVCRRWRLPELEDDLLLAVSELVTNSVLHARTPVTLVAAICQGVVEIGVRDRDPSPPVMRASRTDLISDLDTLTLKVSPVDDSDPRHPGMSVGPAGSVAAGRGLHLLEAVSDAWGVTPLEDDHGSGKEVWFTLALPAGWDGEADCPCQHAADAPRTGSGRPIVASRG